MNKLSVLKLTCSRCGHEWIPRQEEAPRQCPGCKSPYYDRPRVRPKPEAE